MGGRYFCLPVSKSGYTFEELRTQKHTTDLQEARNNWQRNQNQAALTNTEQRFAQADYNLHIQQGQPIPSNREKRNTSAVENKFDGSFIKSINQEQHLPTITNHTNGVVKTDMMFYF